MSISSPTEVSKSKVLQALILDVLKDKDIHHWGEIYEKIYKKVRIAKYQLENPKRRLRKSGKIIPVSLNKELRDKYGFMYGWILVEKDKPLPIGAVENTAGKLPREWKPTFFPAPQREVITLRDDKYARKPEFPGHATETASFDYKDGKWEHSNPSSADTTLTVDVVTAEGKSVSTSGKWKSSRNADGAYWNIDFALPSEKPFDAELRKRGTEKVVTGTWGADVFTKNGCFWCDNKLLPKFKKYTKNLWTAVKGKA